MKLLFFVLFLSFNFLNLAQAGQGGGMDSSGGDSCALEFKDIAQNIHLDLLRKNLKLPIEISHKKFWEKFTETKVKCVAESGSLLESYDKDLVLLQSFFQNSDVDGITKMSVNILKKYFGFTTVVLKNNSEREILAIYNMAKNLRFILPANFKNLSYIGIRREIDSKVIKEKFVIDGNSEVDHRLIIDERSSEMAFSQRREGFFTKQAVCELRLQGVAGTSLAWNMKGFIVQMINCFQPYYQPGYDIQRQ